MLQQNEFDVFEKKHYIVNFKFENYESDFYYAFDKFELKNSNILNNYLYIDVNDIKENLKLISAVCNYKK